jgi:cobalt/nickel transport system permease protein
MIMEIHSRCASPLDRLDPRALLIAATGSAFCFSFIGNLAVSLLCLALSLALLAIRRPPLFPLLKHLAMVNVFILFIWLTVPLTMRGVSIATLGPLSWSREGIGLALLVTVKCNAILLSFLALMAGISLQEIGCAMERLRVPAKLVFLFLFTCRYIHVIGEEWQRLQTAARLRGFVPRNSLHTYRTIANMLGLTIINAIDRSHRIYEAMILRGFNGIFHTVMEFKGGSADIVFTLNFFVFLGSLLFLDIYLK